MEWSEPTAAPWELLDDGLAVEQCDLVVIGCGNILRGDDAAGPVLVRQLHAVGVPPHVRVVDGGTAGMDVAFAMRGAQRVVIVDAAATGSAAGTIYRVPGQELSQLPPIDGPHTHNFRWDHALSFGSWLLGPHLPVDISVFLIEVESCEPGSPLTAPVQAGVDTVQRLIEAEYYPAQRWHVTITDSGHLQLPADLSREHFGADVALVRAGDDVVELIPVLSPSNGGLVLKQRNAAGDRSVLIHEALGFAAPAGHWLARWDAERGALRVDITEPLAASQEGHR